MTAASMQTGSRGHGARPAATKILAQKWCDFCNFLELVFFLYDDNTVFLVSVTADTVHSRYEMKSLPLSKLVLQYFIPLNVGLNLTSLVSFSRSLTQCVFEIVILYCTHTVRLLLDRITTIARRGLLLQTE